MCCAPHFPKDHLLPASLQCPPLVLRALGPPATAGAAVDKLRHCYFYHLVQNEAKIWGLKWTHMDLRLWLGPILEKS